MSGHNIAEQLRQSEHGYTEGILTSLISAGSGAPDGDTAGYIYIRTDGDDEDARLYLRGSTTANDWTAVAAP